VRCSLLRGYICENHQDRKMLQTLFGAIYGRNSRACVFRFPCRSPGRPF
jgi:hypothetical protein